MGILFGLVAAIFWGLGDFLARYATFHLGTYRTLFFIQFVGFACLSVYLLTTGQLQYLLTTTTWQPWAWAILAALFNIASSLALYQAFKIGAISLISPIAASYAVVTVALALLSGEKLTIIHLIAIVFVLLGIIVVATPMQADRTKRDTIAVSFWHSATFRSIAYAIIASLGYGITFWLLGFRVTPTLGGIAPIWLIRLTTPCVLLLLSPVVRQPLRLPHYRTWWLIIGISIFDTLAYVAYASGLLLQGQIAIVTILSSLYSAVTVMLAWVFLRERLHKGQWFGIGVIFIGIALVNV